MFEQDPYFRARIGFILSATDQTFQSDALALQPEGVGLYFTRLAETSFDGLLDSADFEQAMASVSDVARTLLPAGGLDVASYAGEELINQITAPYLNKALQLGAQGSLVSSCYAATRRALRAVDAKRIVIATGKTGPRNQATVDMFNACGAEVLSIQGLNLKNQADLGRLSHAYIRDFSLSVDRADADAIIISSHAMRAMEIVDQIEQIAAKPVLCSNQITIWDAFRCAGISDKFQGYGSLLRCH